MMIALSFNERLDACLELGVSFPVNPISLTEI